MKKIILIFSLFIVHQVFAQKWTTDEQYIQNFAKYAVEEMEKFKIPASITLAQGLLETGGGQSRLAKEGNNHFGIKCKKGWKGRTMRHTDDAPHECFRVYDSPRESYEDHSKFLAYRPYYKNLFKLNMKDYKAWAHGLKKAGYATNRRYAYILISKIEKYKLHQFDNATSENVGLLIAKLYPTTKTDEVLVKLKKVRNHRKADKTLAKLPKDKVYGKKPATRRILMNKHQQIAQNNKTFIKKRKKSKYQLLRTIKVQEHPNKGVEYIVIPDDRIALYDIARKFGIKQKRLMKYNELKTTQLKKGQIIFLERKKNRGLIKKYKVKTGDTMYLIAQRFAIKLKKLYRRNRMTAGQPIKIGQMLKL